MNYIPNYQTPRPDELSLSWIYRLAQANSLTLTQFYTGYLGAEYKRASSIHLDVRDEFTRIYNHLFYADDMDKLYLSTSTFSYESIAMTKGQQTHYSNNVFRPIDKMNRHSHTLISHLEVCPDCIKEDKGKYGEPYLHRSHHLSGASVCYKHHRPLLTFRGRKMEAMSFNMDDYEEIKPSLPIECAMAYAEYSHALLDAGVKADAVSVRDAVRHRMNERGYDLDDTDTLLADVEEWAYKQLWDANDSSAVLKKLKKARNLTMPGLLPILMFLWPDPNDFASAFSDHDPVIKQYVCPDCGRIYCATPQSQADGWGCPYCMSKVPEAERFEQIVKKAGNGEYELLTDFEATNKKVKLWHKPCGRIIETTPDLFLYRGTRCTCKKHDPMFWYEKLDFSPYPGFHLVDYKGYTEEATIHHDECGQDFTCRYKSFRQTPRCGKCGGTPRQGNGGSREKHAY